MIFNQNWLKVIKITRQNVWSNIFSRAQVVEMQMDLFQFRIMLSSDFNLIYKGKSEFDSIMKPTRMILKPPKFSKILRNALPTKHACFMDKLLPPTTLVHRTHPTWLDFWWAHFEPRINFLYQSEKKKKLALPMEPHYDRPYEFKNRLFVIKSCLWPTIGPHLIPKILFLFGGVILLGPTRWKSPADQWGQDSKSHATHDTFTSLITIKNTLVRFTSFFLYFLFTTWSLL